MIRRPRWRCARPDGDPVDSATEPSSDEDYENVWGPVADEMEVGGL